jgi:1-acyl-sn-glycerol-3-phosphate acyltransferase
MLQAVGRRAMRLAGWRFSGTLAALPKFVLIVAPHTSNWDFMIGLAAKLALDLEAHWFGKEALFRGPLGMFMRLIGGRGVKRESSEGVVAELAEMFEGEERFVLVITPEGTRKRVTRWRTGFYHIARAAGVPIVPVAFDWGRREIVLHPPFTPTGDLGRDLATLRALFWPSMAYHPEGFASGGEEPTGKE